MNHTGYIGKCRTKGCKHMEGNLVVRDLESPGQPIVGTYEGREEDVVIYEDADGMIHYAPDDCVRIEVSSDREP